MTEKRRCQKFNPNWLKDPHTSFFVDKVFISAANDYEIRDQKDNDLFGMNIVFSAKYVRRSCCMNISIDM